MDLENYREIKGEFITLREMTLDDAETIYNWRISDSGRFMNQPRGYSLDYQKRWMERLPLNEINYIMLSNDTGKAVGMVAIVGISEQDKNAEVGRLLLAPEYLNTSNPYGLESLKICYDLIINKWKFNKIFGNVLSANIAMLRLQKFLGMKEEGILIQQKIINNEMFDLHLVAIFEKDLNRSYLPKISLLLKAFSK